MTALADNEIDDTVGRSQLAGAATPQVQYKTGVAQGLSPEFSGFNAGLREVLLDERAELVGYGRHLTVPKSVVVIRYATHSH
ncbi:MAG: hypothetical protein WCF85_10555 [Rhodospirillaceae bacterium]